MMPISMVVAAPVVEWVGIRGWLAFGAIGCFTIGLAEFFTPSSVHIEDNCEKYIA